MASIEAALQALTQRLIRDLTDLLVQAPIRDVLLMPGPSTRKARGRPRAAPNADKRPLGRPAGRKKTTGAEKNRSGRKASRQTRRSSEDIETLVERIAAAVREADEGTEGVPIRTIARALKLDTADLTRPMTLALQQKKIRKEGDRRNARYFPGK